MPRRASAVPEDFRTLQARFAGHIRDPEHTAAPDDVEDRRMGIYRDLFFNNLRKYLAGNFPVLRRLYDDADWDRLVREFFVEHRAHTPLFPELPREFLKYLQDGRAPREDDPPYLLELAHWEWIELALDLDERDLDAVPADRDGDPYHGVPVASPLAWPCSYRWPVHLIGPTHQPTEPPDEPTHLLAYRDRADRVRFMQLNAVSRLLLERLQAAEGFSGLKVLERVAADIGHQDTDALLRHGRSLLKDWQAKDIVLGTVPDT